MGFTFKRKTKKPGREWDWGSTKGPSMVNFGLHLNCNEKPLKVFGQGVCALKGCCWLCEHNPVSVRVAIPLALDKPPLNYSQEPFCTAIYYCVLCEQNFNIITFPLQSLRTLTYISVKDPDKSAFCFPKTGLLSYGVYLQFWQDRLSILWYCRRFQAEIL